MDLIGELQKIYKSEINFHISTFWDGGFEVKLGDDMNGYKWEDTFRDLNLGILELIGQILIHYPDSTYSNNYGK